MVKIQKSIFVLGFGCLLGLSVGPAFGAPEWNPVRGHGVEIGPQASRLIVGFKVTSDNAVTKTVQRHSRAQSVKITQAKTSESDVLSLAQRTGVAVAGSRQITPSMHVLFLPKTLYGADVNAALQKLRADPSVRFAAVDQRRYPHSVPDDPEFAPSPGTASGQWYLNTPNPSVMVEGVATMDLSATDAVSAWNITTGSTGIVIADVDTGVIFDHPDLLRAGFGGRLLPGYDFVGEDLNPTNSNALGTFLIANDGDGWDPDPSDPGDWITSSDIANPNKLFATDTAAPSSWHGTRVVGVYGAITNNNTGVAGMSWGPWILPVRALGKGGGYDSDILAGVEWAAGLPITNVPDNPYPADIINLSIGGGTESCSGSAYEGELTTVTTTGALVVISAGNGGNPGQTAPVERIRVLMAENQLTFEQALEATRLSNVFTTHTSVPAGIDLFDQALMLEYFGKYAEQGGFPFEKLLRLGLKLQNDGSERFSMAVLALKTSAFRNAVSVLHRQVSQEMFQDLWPKLPRPRRRQAAGARGR